MAKDSKLVYGASGKTNVLMFEPESLHLVTDKTHLLYDERINLPIDEGMVLNIAELGVPEYLSSAMMPSVNIHPPLKNWLKGFELCIQMLATLR